MKYILIIVAVVLLLIAGVFVLGALTPRTHTAAVRAQYSSPPESVYTVIRDVSRGADWRSGVSKVEVLSREGEPVRWRETADWGTLTFVRDVDEPPRRIVSRIADQDQGFGGTWTYEIAPTQNGSTLTITENGVVDSPLFRFMSKYVMGHYQGLETYVRDLGKRLGEGEVQPVRVH